MIPAKGEPSQSRVLRRFRYDARHGIVKCPGGKTLRPRRSEERGRYYGSRTQDCAGCALRSDCLPEVSREQGGFDSQRVSGAVARAPAACAMGGGGAPAVAPAHGALGGLSRRGEELARTVAGDAPRSGERADPVLPDGDGGEPQAGWPPPLRRVSSSSGRPVPPGDAVCAHMAPSRADWASSPPPREPPFFPRFKNRGFSTTPLWPAFFIMNC